MKEQLAYLRFLHGLAQMMGAVVSFYLLSQVGMTPLVLTSVAVTSLCTLISLRVFGQRR